MCLLLLLLLLLLQDIAAVRHAVLQGLMLPSSRNQKHDSNLCLLCLQDIAAVRDAVLDAAGNAWQGARSATVDVMNYQYGEQVRLLCSCTIQME
jgi:hypothetical protein